MGKKNKSRNDTSDYSVEMILLSFLWFEDHDSLGYWDGVAVWNSKASKKKSSAMHVYLIWRSYIECHFHNFTPQNFKTQRVSSLGIQEVSTDWWLLKNVAEICCILRNSSDSDINVVAYVFVFFSYISKLFDSTQLPSQGFLKVHNLKI